MERRTALGLMASPGLVAVGTASAAGGRPATPPRLTAGELARRVKEEGFSAASLYATELEFRGVVTIKREVPLLAITGMTGPYSQVHLYGSGGNVDVGKEMVVVGLIVDHGFGALMVWMREWKYADA